MFTGNLDRRLDRLSVALGPCTPDMPRHWAIVHSYRRLLEATVPNHATLSPSERREAKLAAAVERATAKLTVLEYNALALHIRAEVLADEEAKRRQS